ncbi:class 1a ribonucleoside-diphosphate reductase subunit alpha [Buchnera aphidicola]|uniref:Ribonucleoside-diphosphate reductase n=1 Tax=Buchnera aphidicola (Sarucallis kahawaluokalani) TaxID=1241878 RepID=A0A4D6YJ76_9GAMM|nr:class 1a ribonucleoside-diphosphate reductase subunit alpha [Buchnera aphidicola]QCI25930.1 ribonucleoside-diphosphate reductase subunit alpha [Buchnera aphidicola (Sarucallis kahawaluokalani)]
MPNVLLVTKRNGNTEKINFQKIKNILERASKKLNNISIEKIILNTKIQLYNKISTNRIHDIIIKTTADLISEHATDYQFMAARLTIFQLRKKAYGTFHPPSLYEHVTNMIKLKKYDEKLITGYSQEEYNIMDKFIHHNRDMNFSYAAVKQLEGKYLIQDRVSGKIYESAQFLYIMISACLFLKYPQKKKMKYIKNFYDAISKFKISLPTPIMAGVRTPTRQFSSCVLIECADSLNSINATASSIVKYISQKAGVGINVGQIRALGSSIRNGENFHTGCIPFYKYFQTAIKSCSQGGIRGGAATLFYPIWHLEIESLIVLKNNRGIEENRVRHVDYCVQINKIMYQRLINQEYITLFSPSDVPGLYNYFFSNQKKFIKLYIKYEKNPNIRKKIIKSIELFSLIMQERTSTGRIYIQNVDHCNTHSAFNPEYAPIKQSNLCLEVTLPTIPIHDLHDTNSEIALCILSAFNLGCIKNLKELKQLSNLLVRALDEIIDYQEYPVVAAKNGAKNRRSIGIGVINFAYYLAKNNVRYSDGSANNLTHTTFEYIQYYLLYASCKLAKEKGACPLFYQTNYARGLLPIDTYKKSIDKICKNNLQLNWKKLRNQIMKYGLRNSTVSAIMPTETSSQIANATNGIEPPRGYITIKASKDGMLKQVVPEFIELKKKYELLWDIPNNTGYLNLIGIMQKFIDQSISTNTNYDPKKFPKNKIPMKTLLQDLLTAYNLGLKTLYYQNTRDGVKEYQSEVLNNNYNNQCNHGSCIL